MFYTIKPLVASTPPAEPSNWPQADIGQYQLFRQKVAGHRRQLLAGRMGRAVDQQYTRFLQP
jgi:hypothetical protein